MAKEILQDLPHGKVTELPISFEFPFEMAIPKPQGLAKGISEKSQTRREPRGTAVSLPVASSPSASLLVAANVASAGVWTNTG